MTPETQRALDRLQKSMDRAERRRRRRRRFSIAPFYLGLGLLLGHQMLARLVPMVWDAVLPRGLAQAETLRGPAALVWELSRACRAHFTETVIVLVGAFLAGLVLSWAGRPGRLLVWLAAVVVVLLDAGIVFITLKTGLDTVAGEAGLM